MRRGERSGSAFEFQALIVAENDLDRRLQSRHAPVSPRPLILATSWPHGLVTLFWGPVLSTALHLPAPLLRVAVGYGFVGGLATGLIGRVPSSFISISYLVLFSVLYIYYGMTVPVLITEQANALGALKRSKFLTENHRGPLFGIYFLSGLAWFAMFLVVLAVTVRVVSLAQRPTILRIASMLTIPPFLAVLNTVIYRALRRAKEGIDIKSSHGLPTARVRES